MIHAPQCSQQHYLQLPRYGSKLNVHQQKWIKKMLYVYTINYYSAIKKNQILPLATTWMGLECIIPSEIS